MTWLVDYHAEYFAELSAEAEVLQDAVFSPSNSVANTWINQRRCIKEIYGCEQQGLFYQDGDHSIDEHTGISTLLEAFSCEPQAHSSQLKAYG